MKAAMIAAFPVALAACATTGTPDSTPPAHQPVEQVCDAAPAQYHIGHPATQAMGAAILKDSGAAALRWGPPNAAWTMDYRTDRVNVRYDNDMKITAITCG